MVEISRPVWLQFRFSSTLSLREPASAEPGARCHVPDQSASKRGQVFSSFVISILVGSMASSAKREGAEVETPKSSSPKLARNASSKSSKKGLLANGSAGVARGRTLVGWSASCCL